MSDLARAAGVSKNTISLALRNDRQIPPATRKRIAALAKKFGYRKNAVVAHLMTELRRARTPRFHSTLALVNAHRDPAAVHAHPTIPTYVEGCRRRADDLGYVLDEFWLHDPTLTAPRLTQVLRARGIQGLVLIGLMRDNRLPDCFASLWEEFPTVVTGVRTQNPALSFASTDHYLLALATFRKCLELGYTRPALVLDPDIDRLVDGRFSAGVQSAQLDLPRARRTKALYPAASPGTGSTVFRKWLRREKPDVILTLYNTIRHWLEQDGWAVPNDIGLVQLEWRATSPDWAGMNQHNDVVGATAIEMLVGMIQNNERGIPEFPRATLIGSSWVDGDTVRGSSRWGNHEGARR